jgi:hypothetical protein
MNENIDAAGNDVKSSRTEIAFFADNLASSKRNWTKDIVKRVDPHRFFGGAIEAQTNLFKTSDSITLRVKVHLTE